MDNGEYSYVVDNCRAGKILISFKNYYTNHQVDKGILVMNILLKTYLVLLLFFFGCKEIDTPSSQRFQNESPDIVSAVDYYKEWSGHTREHLESVYRGLKAQGCTSFIFYAGDSSLDNKHWIFQGKNNSSEETYLDDTVTAAAINGYEKILRPPRMVKDVDYWVNYYLLQLAPPKVCSIMTSIEASTLAQRDHQLLIQDAFIRDHITENDYLIISVAGNDIAALARNNVIFDRAMSKPELEQSNFFKTMLPFYKDKTKDFVERLIAKRKPKAVLIGTLYYLDENIMDVKNNGAWPRGILLNLGYGNHPTTLQNAINLLYEQGTKKIAIPGVNIIPILLAEALDGKNPDDYIQLVEPSSQGSKKMARLFVNKLFGKNLSE